MVDSKPFIKLITENYVTVDSSKFVKDIIPTEYRTQTIVSYALIMFSHSFPDHEGNLREPKDYIGICLKESPHGHQYKIQRYVNNCSGALLERMDIGKEKIKFFNNEISEHVQRIRNYFVFKSYKIKDGSAANVFQQMVTLFSKNICEAITQVKNQSQQLEIEGSGPIIEALEDSPKQIDNEGSVITTDEN